MPDGELLPFDEMVYEIFDLFLHLGSLQRDGVTLVGHLDDELAQFVQLSFDLEQTLGGHGKPAETQGTTKIQLLYSRSNNINTRGS